MTATTIRREIEVANRYRPGVAVPTLMLLSGVYASLFASSYLALTESLPMWLAAVANGIVLYGTYTVVHEGVHGNIVTRGSRFRWVNMAAALLAAIPLWILIYPHRASHIVHHKKCNTDEDPDIYARGSFGVVTFWRIPLAILGQFNPVEQYRQCTRYGLTRWQRYFSLANYVFYVGLVTAAIGFGYAYQLLILWFIPFFVGYAVMLVFFTWIPHHPHVITGRYHDTRCSLWLGGNVLTQGQNYHLIHHMMPWVPWYRYEKVYLEIEPLLQQHGAIIDGFWPRPAQDALRAVAKS